MFRYSWSYEQVGETLQLSVSPQSPTASVAVGMAETPEAIVVGPLPPPSVDVVTTSAPELPTASFPDADLVVTKKGLPASLGLGG